MIVRRLFTISLFTLSLFLSNSLSALAGQTVLVSLDFTEALALVLTKDTGIEIKRAVPANYTANTHASYMKKHWADFSGVAKEADTVLTISSAWPNDPLYPWARRANIRIVPIDISSPMDRSRAGLPLLDAPKGSKSGPVVWYSPGNCARMADIAGSDLSLLFPDKAETIQKNLDIFKQELFKIRAKYELEFGMLDAFEVIAFTPDFLYLTDEFGIATVGFFLKPEVRWQEEDYARLAEVIKTGDVKAVIGKWEPKDEISRIITESGAGMGVLARFALENRENVSSTLLSYYGKNLEILLQSLQTKQL